MTKPSDSRQGELFGHVPTDHYPDAAGYKEPTTSAEAAATVDAATLRGKVLDVLKHGPLTADECASWLGESILSIRPRLSELRALGLIRDTGERRENLSGKSAIVWETFIQDGTNA